MEILSGIAAFAASPGADLVAGRFVAWTILCVTAALSGWIVSRETGRALFGLASAGLLAMGLGMNAPQSEAMRPVLLLILAGLATLRFVPGFRGTLGAALLLSVAFLLEPLTLLFGITACCHLLMTDRRRTAVFALALGIGSAAAVLCLGPWYASRFGFLASGGSPPSFQFSIGRAQEYIGETVFGSLGYLSLPALLGLAPSPPLGRRPEALWWWAAVAAVGIGIIGTLEGGARDRTLLPTLGVLAVLGPIAIARLIRGLPQISARRTGIAVGMALALQLIAMTLPARGLERNAGRRPTHPTGAAGPSMSALPR